MALQDESVRIATRKYVNDKVAAAGNGAFKVADPWVGILGWKIGSVDPATGMKTRTPDANSRWGVRMFSADAWTATKLDILVATAASTDATGYRVAIYDAAMNLVATTGDVSSQFMSAQLNYFRATITFPAEISMPAGRFFVLFRWGTGGTRAALYNGNNDNTQSQNAGMVWDVAQPENFYRLFTCNGDWSGATAPANGSAMGFCDRNFSLPIFGLK